MKLKSIHLFTLLLGFTIIIAVAIPGSAYGTGVPDVDSPNIYSIDEGTISLTWHQSAVIEGVRIYRRHLTSSDLATVVWTAAADAYGYGIHTDTGLSAGEVYEYCLIPYIGTETGFVHTWLTAVPLGKPQITGISEVMTNVSGERQVNVTWRGITEADGYEFWLGLEEGPFDVISDTTGTEGIYTLPDGFITCSFMVRAYVTFRSVKYVGPWSNSMSLYAPEESADILPPDNLEAFPYGDDSVALFWDVTGVADTYWIYRSTGYGHLGAYLASTHRHNYLDTMLTSGTTYFYNVAAINGTSRSPFSNATWATPMNTPEITGISLHANIPAGTLGAVIGWTEACLGARYLVGEQSPIHDPEIGNTADTSFTAVNPLPAAVTVYRYCIQPYIEVAEGIISYGPPSDPEEVTYPSIGPTAISGRVRFEGTPPWADSWHSGWLEDLIESYTDRDNPPGGSAPGSGMLAELARKMLKGAKLTDNEQNLKNLLLPDGLALLIAAYSAPPDAETGKALSGLLNQIDSILGRRSIKALDKEEQICYERLLEHARVLLGAVGESPTPVRITEKPENPHINPTWTPTPWAVHITPMPWAIHVTPVIVPIITMPPPTAGFIKP